MGLDWKLTDRCSPLQINAVGKAGLYGNQADGGIYEFQGANRNSSAAFTEVNTDPPSSANSISPPPTGSPATSPSTAVTSCYGSTTSPSPATPPPAAC